ncbi:MAG: hypothetical protein JXR51_07045 [Bacteroidales bacterium]|nr:hypothetical protein [Bacteroidales bacterium]MBN2756919.1 hypothetical protein [Bacteroidales bacterium]
MKNFDKNGMLIIPTPKEIKSECESEEILVVKECYCQNGHQLINKRVCFNDLPGILLKVKKLNYKEGFIALSPVYNHKHRISIDIDLIKGESLQLYCPECSIELPIYSNCTCCDGKLIAVFLDKTANFNNCITIGNTVGCKNSSIIANKEILSEIKYIITR